MFDFFDTSKLLIIGVVALLVIPPKDLPSVLRQVGQAVGKLRRMAADFQNQFKEALADAELDTLKKDLMAVSDSAKADLNKIIGTHEEPIVPAAQPLEPAPPAADMLAEPAIKPKAKRAASLSSKAKGAVKAPSVRKADVQVKTAATTKPTKRTAKADV